MNDLDKKQDGTNHKVILIAEDEEINFHFLAMLLAKLNPGSKLLHATNGREAVELVKANPGITLILMDIKMPVMDGYEATKEIKTIKPDMKIIAQTALSAFDAKEKALQAGCDDFITKPIKMDLLQNPIDHLSQSSG